MTCKLVAVDHVLRGLCVKTKREREIKKKKTRPRPSCRGANISRSPPLEMWRNFGAIAAAGGNSEMHVTAAISPDATAEPHVLTPHRRRCTLYVRATTTSTTTTAAAHHSCSKSRLIGTISCTLDRLTFLFHNRFSVPNILNFV